VALCQNNAGYEQFQNRTNSIPVNLKGSFGYLWKENERKEHLLNVTEITFASPQNITELYQSQINTNTRKVIEKQLILVLPIPTLLLTPCKR
jgi:hypothetical protein